MQSNMFKNNAGIDEVPTMVDSNAIQNSFLPYGSPSAFGTNNFSQNTLQRPQSYYQPNYEQVFFSKSFLNY